MKLGLDFDNTIVDHSETIQRLAPRYIDLPEFIKLERIDIRTYLREQGREEEWTRFQGIIYGPGLEVASPYKGAIRTIRRLSGLGVDLYIISHKTKYPYIGERYDLHQAARSWISRHLGVDSIITSDKVHLVETLEHKIDLIASKDLDYFLDDLIQVTTRIDSVTCPILFSPENQEWEGKRIATWNELPVVLGIDERA